MSARQPRAAGPARTSGDELIRRIASFERDLVVQAGAGTGKTHALVTLYLHLVAGLTSARRTSAPGRIAVVTFTDKAAGELIERIRLRLRRLATDPMSAAEQTLEEAARSFELPLPPAAQFRRALAEVGAAPIGTFHTLAMSLLRRHATRARIDPDFVLLDEIEARARASSAAERSVLEALERGLPAVAELVAEYDYRGAGRRRGLLDHLVWLRARLAEEGRAVNLEARYGEAHLASEWEAARLAYETAVRELSRAAETLAKKSAETARSLADRRLPSDPAMLLEEAAAIKAGLRYLRSKDELLPAVKEQISAAQKRLVEAETGLRARPLVAALDRLVRDTERRYRADKQAAGALDFSDLLVHARDLLRDHEDLRSATRARFDAVLVDEFQDTSRVQAELVELVSGPAEEGGGRRFLVGDRKQSIYEFRGADVAVFSRETEALVGRGGEELWMRTSRRSTPSLLALVNALFSRAMGALGEDPLRGSWQLRFEMGRDDLAPFRVEAGPTDVGGELLQVNNQDSASTREREARAIAVRLLQLNAAGRPFGGCAILLRRFTHLETYLRALRRANVPYFVVRGRGFYSTEEVRDLASALTLLEDPEDKLALVAVLRSPLVGLSDGALVRLELARRLRLSSLLNPDSNWSLLSEGDRDRLTDFAKRFREVRRGADRAGPAATLRTLIEGGDLEAVLASMADGEQRIANLERLIEQARAEERRGGELRSFIGWLRRMVGPASEMDAAQAQIVDERDDVVRVMTVHQAKGLEFPVVFVPACGAPERGEYGPLFFDPDEGFGIRVHGADRRSGRVHSSASAELQVLRQARLRAESLRLFYVATTRARDLVIFSGESSLRSGPLNDTWRSHLDALASEPETTSLLKLIDGDALRPPPRQVAQMALFESAESSSVAPPPLLQIRPRGKALGLTAAVTQLGDFQVCPRRYHQFHELELREHPSFARERHGELLNLPEEVVSPDEGALPLDPLRRGTLAHRLLERCDLSRVGEDLGELIAADGYDRTDPLVTEVEAHVTAFLRTPFVRELEGRQVEIRRELPFFIGVPLASGGRLYLRGQIDLVVFDQAGVRVIDYKHARRSDSDEYRFQLDAYALAARLLYPRAPIIATGLAFLKEANPTPVMEECRAPEDFMESLAHLGESLIEARLTHRFDGRPVEFCRQIHCGFISRCHPRESE